MIILCFDNCLTAPKREGLTELLSAEAGQNLELTVRDRHPGYISAISRSSLHEAFVLSRIFWSVLSGMISGFPNMENTPVAS